VSRPRTGRPAQRWVGMSEPNTLDQARSALDRAHRAAMAMEGAELRRALEEARDALNGNGASHVQAAGAKVAQALADLDGGPLDEMERLLEQARADLGQAGSPGGSAAEKSTRS